MTLMTGQEYRASLKKRRAMRIYLNGELIDNPTEHPIIEPSINSIALTYELAEDPRHKDLITAKSSLTGKEINRFTHLHQSNGDLLKKIQMQRLLGQSCGTCFQRCVGMDAVNSLFSVTYEIDEKYGTPYHKRFVEYLKVIQEKDLVIDGCMTDVKGDRSKSPSEQKDPDLFLRVVERRPDGVIIRGAKAHQTGAVNSHEVLVMPTLSMKEADKDYAFVGAIPADDPNIIYIYGRQSCDLRKLDVSIPGNIDSGSRFGGQEALMIFDNVFVPNERIFMDGEYDFSGMLVERFSGYHRQSYCCKVGVGDVLIGAAALAADYNGVPKASHIKDKITEMIHLNETIFSSGVAAAALGTQTKAGNYLIDLMHANVCKHNVTRFPSEMCRLLQDIAGGIMVTLPSVHDLVNPDTKEFLEKYLVGVSGVSIEDKMKLMRLIENLTLGRGAVAYVVESIHGAGSPAAQRVMYNRLSNIEEKKEFAKNIAGIGLQELVLIEEEELPKVTV